MRRVSILRDDTCLEKFLEPSLHRLLPTDIPLLPALGVDSVGTRSCSCSRTHLTVFDECQSESNRICTHSCAEAC